MKKILNYVFLFVLTLCVLVSCKGTDANELIKTLLVEQDSYVDADFYVIGEMKSGEEIYPITWESDNACLSVSETKNEAGYYTVKVTRPEDEAQTITLTATLTVSKKNTATKAFEFRVYPIDVYDILDNFAFEHKGIKVEMGSSIELPLTTTHKEKTATITWSTEDTDVVTLDETGSKATFATVVKETPITLTATLAYKGQTTSISYSLTIAPYATDFEKLKEWYECEGITQVLSGYVLEIATVYSDKYNNVSLYISNEDFTAGYYLYRVKMTVEEASQLKVGAHVTATGTVNTSYSGLMETNAGGNLVVDEDIAPVDVTEKYYAMDNDLIANVPSLYYRTSTLVSLANWKVTKINKEFNDGSTKWVLNLEKDGVKTTVCYSNYIASTPMPNKNGGEESQVYKDVLAKLGTLAEGDYVNITGLLSYYNVDKTKYDQESYQIYIQGADSITKIENGSDETNTAGKKMAAAIAALEGFKAAYTSTTVIELPTTAGEATVAWNFHNKYHNGAVLEGTTLTLTPQGYSIVSLNATLTIGDYTTVLYFSFVLEELSDEEIADRVLADTTIEEQYASGEVELPSSHELFSGVEYSYELKEETYKSVTLANGVLTVNNLSLLEDETVVIVLTIKVGEVTKTKEISVLIHKLEVTSVADFLKAENSDTPTLLQGVITAVNGIDPEKGDSFVLTDAAGTSVFCYDKSLILSLGDEVQILALYGENKGFQQIASPVLVKTISQGNDVTTKSGTKVEKTAAEIYETLTAAGMTEAKVYETYGAQYLAISGYVVLNGGYTYLATSADGTGCVSLYANKGLKASDYVGCEVVVYGFARGCSIGSAYLTIQVQSIQAAETDANKAAVELGKVSFEKEYEAGVIELTTASNGVALSYAVKSGAENAVIADNKLTLTASEAAVEVVITVTATLGEATTSKDFTLTIKGTAPEVDEEIVYTSIEEANSIGSALAHNTYTTEKYYVKGTITEIKNTTYGNLYITDGTNTLYVYGLYSVDGSTRFDAMEVKPAVGDEIIVYGVLGQYNNNPQMKNAWLYEEAETEDIYTSIEEANSIGSALAHNTYTTEKYYVKGTITEIKNTTYGNLYITDGTNTLYVYGLYSADGSTRFDALEVKPAVGDEIVVYGVLGQYNNNPQMKNAWLYEEVEEEPETPETPETPEVPEGEISIEKALEIATTAGSDYTTEKYTVTGTISQILNAAYGNVYITNGTTELYVYGLYNADGSVKYSELTDKPAVGDIITVSGVLGAYVDYSGKSTLQMKNGWIQSVSSNDEYKAKVALESIVAQFQELYIQSTDLVLDKVYETVVLTVTPQAGATTLVWNAETLTLSINPGQTEVTETVTIVVTIGEQTFDSVISIKTKLEEVSSVTFDLVSNFSTYGKSWANSYTSKTLSASDLGASVSGTVTLSNVSKQTGTITDRPVMASKKTDQYVTLALDGSSSISTVTFNFAKWTTKTFSYIRIEYYNGSEWVSCSNTITDPASGSLTSTVLTGSVTSVRLVINGGSSSNKQLGITSIVVDFAQ